MPSEIQSDVSMAAQTGVLTGFAVSWAGTGPDRRCPAFNR